MGGDLFILEDTSKLLIPHIVYQFVGFVIYHSSALRNSFLDLCACSARELLLHVVYLPAGVLYTYLELSSCKFLLERVLDPFVHFL